MKINEIILGYVNSILYLYIVGQRDQVHLITCTMESTRYIAYLKGENNGYDDSDFYDMIIDTKEEKIIKHVWGSTRFPGSIPFGHEFLDLTEEKDSKLLDVALEIAKVQVLPKISGSCVQVGDIVSVTNPRVKAFKDETFKVKSLRDFKLRYGKVASTTLFGVNDKGDEIKTSESNVTIIEHSDSKIEAAAYRLMVGLSL